MSEYFAVACRAADQGAAGVLPTSHRRRRVDLAPFAPGRLQPLDSVQVANFEIS